MAGTKTSVWLGEELHKRWKASGLSLTEIVSHGLDAVEQDRSEVPDIGAGVTAIREDLASLRDDLPGIVREQVARVAGESHA